MKIYLGFIFRESFIISSTDRNHFANEIPDQDHGISWSLILFFSVQALKRPDPRPSAGCVSFSGRKKRLRGWALMFSFPDKGGP